MLEKLKAGEALTAKEKTIHENGLVSVLKSLHDELDRAVLEAYGWNDLAPLLEVVNGNASVASVASVGWGEPKANPNDSPSNVGVPSSLQPTNPTTMTREDAKRMLDETLLERLVALNAERAAEERRGLIRWLRPEFQSPAQAPVQAAIEDGATTAPAGARTGSTSTAKQPWPATLPDQVAAVAQLLSEAGAPVAEEDIAARYTGRGPWKKRLPQILETLVALGRARRTPDGRAVAL